MREGVTARGSLPSHNPLRGIALKVVSVVAFVGMSSLIKAAGRLPAGEIVFFRSFFAGVTIMIFLAFRGEALSGFRTRHPWSHMARGLVGVCSMGLGFFALTRLPLPEAIALNYAQPLFVLIFSVIFLGETIRIHRWSAVVVGLLGVAIISWPKLTLLDSPGGLDNDELLGVIAVLAAAAISAIAMLLVRRLVQVERTHTIVLWFSMTATVVGLLTIPFGWERLTLAQAAFLIGAGVCGGVAQILMTQAYRYAEASTVAPFEYVSMIVAIAVGYFAFAELPTMHTLVGSAIVIGAGIFIVWRERQLGIRRAEAKRAAAPQ
ncbi:MAG: DMT family transporter [Rhizobiaceae bacterium]|nr:DMT family transporter [Rhizobiaceae bacterium]